MIKKHLKKPARYFDDDDRHLTPLEQYPMDSSNTNEGDSPISNDGDNLFEDLFNFLKTTNMKSMTHYLPKKLVILTRKYYSTNKTRELLKRK